MGLGAMATQRAGRSRGLPVQIATSAGGVVCRLHEGRWQVVLCGQGQGLWSLPKGSPEPGETLEQTALREVREETGLTAEIREPLGSITYWFSSASEGARYRKTVHFFLMFPTGGSLEHHDLEFAEVRWHPAEEALGVLGYRNERHMVRLALERLGAKQHG